MTVNRTDCPCNQLDSDEILVAGLKAVGIVIGFLILARVWLWLWHLILRRCLRFQRYKSDAKIAQILEIYDSVKRGSSAFGSDGLGPSCASETGIGCARVEHRDLSRLVTVDQDYSKRVRKAWVKKAPKNCFYAFLLRVLGKKAERRVKRFPTTTYQFKGTRWIPKNNRNRRFYKYLRGNFLTLLGSVFGASLCVLGFYLAIRTSRLDLGEALSKGSLLALVGFFKLADHFSPLLAYYKILWSDLVERGTLVEVNMTTGGFSHVRTVSGCVVALDSTFVTLLCYGEHSNPNAFEQSHYIDAEGNLKTLKSLETTGKRNADVYLKSQRTATTSMVKIPTNVFADSVISKPVSWRPEITYERIAVV